MGHDKLRKFAENETFSCLLQPDSKEILEGGFFDLKDHPIKGNWARKMFGREKAEIILELGCGKGEYTLDLARRYPDKCFIGVDIKGARLWKGAKTATLEKIPNVAFLRTRIEFITAFFASDEVSEIWLTFSDPQMKSENSRLPGKRRREFLQVRPLRAGLCFFGAGLAQPAGREPPFFPWTGLPAFAPLELPERPF